MAQELYNLVTWHVSSQKNLMLLLANLMHMSYSVLFSLECQETAKMLFYCRKCSLDKLILLKELCKNLQNIVYRQNQLFVKSCACIFNTYRYSACQC